MQVVNPLAAIDDGLIPLDRLIKIARHNINTFHQIYFTTLTSIVRSIANVIDRTGVHVDKLTRLLIVYWGRPKGTNPPLHKWLKCIMSDKTCIMIILTEMGLFCGVRKLSPDDQIRFCNTVWPMFTHTITKVLRQIKHQADLTKMIIELCIYKL